MNTTINANKTYRKVEKEEAKMNDRTRRTISRM